MKKLLAVTIVLLVSISVLALSGCSGQQDEALVGTWTWDMDASYRYVFNSDGTGDRGWPGILIQTFTWSTSGSQLRINLDENPGRGYIRNERWNFNISGDVLNIDSRQTNDAFSYIRVP